MATITNHFQIIILNPKNISTITEKSIKYLHTFNIGCQWVYDTTSYLTVHKSPLIKQWVVRK